MARTTRTTTKQQNPAKREAQQEKRRAKMAELTDLYAATVATIEDDEDAAQRFAALALRLHTYSPRNQALVFAQCEHATAVMGFRAWQGKGRQVRKGETGISILAPIKLTEQDEKGEPARDEKGEIIEKLLCKPVAVFDISQTDPITPETETQTEAEPTA